MPLPCSCCPRPFAEIGRGEDGTVALIIRSRHDSGIKHQNVITIKELLRMASEIEQAARESLDITHPT